MRSKSFLLTVSCFVITLFWTAAVRANDESFMLLSDEKNIYIAGKTEPEKQAAVLILNEGFEISDIASPVRAEQAIFCADQTTSDEKGVYSFVFDKSNISDRLSYAVYIIGSDSALPQTGKLSSACSTVGKDILNVLDFGIDNTGIGDMTVYLTALHNTGKKIYYPSGTYRFNGKTLNLSGGVEFESLESVKVKNDVSDANIIQFDNNGNLIGLIQNHLEHDESDEGSGWKMDIGTLVPPPVSTAEYKTKADFIPFWYNDFGLEFTRSNSLAYKGWYYWSWNFASNVSDDPKYAYDPDRHPLIGFYKGDDSTVLDWQCYWLKEYGAKAVTLYSTHTAAGISKTWSSEADRNYWIYQLFNNTPNFKGLKYILTLTPPFVTKGEDHTEMKNEVTAEWNNTVEDIYKKYSNCYCIEKNGKLYPVIYVHEEGALLGVFDDYTGVSGTVKFLSGIADKFKSSGFGGVALFVRNKSNTIDASNNTLAKNGVLRYIVNYEPQTPAGAENYAEAVEDYTGDIGDNIILNSFTGAFTHSPHPSGWNKPGENPSLFNKLINKQLEHIKNNSMPEILTCYNVAEWAEGGPGLQPTMKNRFGYLQALKDAVVISDDNAVMNMNISIIDNKANVVTDSAPLLSGGGLTVRAVISDGADSCDKFILVAAVYKGDMLKCVKLYDNLQTSFEFTLNESDLYGADKLKLMLLKDMNSLMPLTEEKLQTN